MFLFQVVCQSTRCFEAAATVWTPNISIRQAKKQMCIHIEPKAHHTFFDSDPLTTD